MKGFFIAGTDTGVGKTVVSSALVYGLRCRAQAVAPRKPIASGAEFAAGRAVNEDAMAMLNAAGLDIAHYDTVNPFLFQPPIAPHIAAAQSGTDVGVDAVLARCALATDAVNIVEGVGGWLVPLNGSETMADLALALGLPVILVVGIRLGCINHALLTVQAIEASGCELAGWVANQLESDMPVAAENIDTLINRISAPLLGRLPRLTKVDHETAATALGPGIDRLFA